MNTFEDWYEELRRASFEKGDGAPSAKVYLAARATWDAAIDAAAQLAEERNDNADCLYSAARILGSLASEIEEMKNENN